MCEELGVDYIIINGSDEGRHIDTLRTTIKNFASTVSLDESNTHKVVIIDEADYMNVDSVQFALRNFIETFYKNCRFIFTCNFRNKIIFHYIVVVPLLIFVLQMVRKSKLFCIFKKTRRTIEGREYRV